MTSGTLDINQNERLFCALLVNIQNNESHLKNKDHCILLDLDF